MTSKTFAIITDIHSNISALNNALKIIDSKKNVDQIICLGDCFSLGPEPEKTLKKLKEINNCIFIRGNHDRYIIEKLWEEELPTLEGMDPYDPICKAIVENEKWTADKIGDEGVDFIIKMAISHREIVDSTLIEFTHAWYQRDDHPPSIEEALNHFKNQRLVAPEYGGDRKKIASEKFTDPIYGLPAHWAPNDLLFYTGNQFPLRYRNGAFIAFHGSTNRMPYPQAGYVVGFIPFEEGVPKGEMEIFADGFIGREVISDMEEAEYRPMGLAPVSYTHLTLPTKRIV